ncbi:hypothetical protein SAMN05216357_102354 [Porphyromonadaceae bacterium KH3CP3RA]|nr:hypothetical protein SAMN05216357_102354 [Porphyromonadaceae bacterium KH3CP3RA]
MNNNPGSVFYPRRFWLLIYGSDKTIFERRVFYLQL